MRVISGTIRGHKLKTIKSKTVRPTADRVKEALFNIMANKIKGKTVLDLFAGSGALGIEAISRGAQFAVFIDSDPQVLNILRQNLKNCRIHDKAEIIQWNIEKNLNCLDTFPYIFDLVFMDPPYGHNFVEKTIDHLLQSNRLAPHTTIVAEHEPGMQTNLINTTLILSDTRRYGNNELSFYELSPQHRI